MRFIGVSSSNGGKSWHSRLNIATTFPEDVIAHYGLNKQVYLGTHDTEELAAHARDV